MAVEQKGNGPRENREGKRMVEKEVAAQIGEEISRQIKTKHLTEKAMLADVEKFQENFRTYHKVLYGALVFFGVVLVWYGLWTVIPDIPGLKNPIVAVLVGMAILVSTGTWYKKFVG